MGGSHPTWGTRCSSGALGEKSMVSSTDAVSGKVLTWESLAYWLLLARETQEHHAIAYHERRVCLAEASVQTERRGGNRERGEKKGRNVSRYRTEQTKTGRPKVELRKEGVRQREPGRQGPADRRPEGQFSGRESWNKNQRCWPETHTACHNACIYHLDSGWSRPWRLKEALKHWAAHGGDLAPASGLQTLVSSCCAHLSGGNQKTEVLCDSSSRIVRQNHFDKALYYVSCTTNSDGTSDPLSPRASCSHMIVISMVPVIRASFRFTL